MGTAASCMQVSTGNRHFTRIRRRRRGYRIRRRVQSLWKLIRKLRLNALRELWPQPAAFKHRRLRLVRENIPEMQESVSSEDEFSFADLVDTDDWSLIPGLPQELALRCLARVPRVLHGKIRAVCKPWRKVAESQEFLDLRKQLEVSEDWLYLHVGTDPRLDEVHVGCTGGRWQIVGGFSLWHALDPYRYRWHALPPIPYDATVTGGHVVLGAASAILNGELYVIGGAPFGRPALRDMWVYSPRKNLWRRAKPMLTPRFGCLVGAIGKKLYVVGGSGICHLTGYSLPCLEIYNLDTNSWQYAASARGKVTQHPCNPLKHVAVVENKLLVTGPQSLTGRTNSGMYDPGLDMWTEIKPGLRNGWGKPSTILDGKLYTVGFGCYQEYFPDRDLWAPVSGQNTDTLVEWDPRLVSAMAASNGKLYMVGTMGPALIVVIAPLKDGQVTQSIRWHTMKLPNGVDYLGDLGYCSCQVISI